MRKKYLALLLSAIFCLGPVYGVVAKKKAKSTSKTASKAAPRKGTSTSARKGTPSRSGKKSASSRNAAPARRRTTQRAQATPTPDRYKEIQQALADKGFFKGEVNGTWGPDSVEALKKFQADQKLQVDGKIGALSLIALGLGPKRQASNEAAVTMPQKTNP